MFGDPVALAILAGAGALAVLVTWIAARLVGRWIAARNLLLARIATMLVAPIAMLAFGVVRFRIDAVAHPESDWPAMGLAGTILVVLLMPGATIPTAWLTLRRPKTRPATSPGDARPVEPATIRMQRDSVCMADDVDAPHEQTFPVTAGDTLADLAARVARSGYLPMPSDAWGWTIEAGGAVIAIRPGIVHRRVTTLEGAPAAIAMRDHPLLTALYVRPGSRWRDRDTPA